MSDAYFKQLTERILTLNRFYCALLFLGSSLWINPLRCQQFSNDLPSNEFSLFTDLARPLNIFHPGISIGASYRYRNDLETVLQLGIYKDLFSTSLFYPELKGQRVSISQVFGLPYDFFFSADFVADYMSYQVKSSEAIGEFVLIFVSPEYFKNYHYQVDRRQFGMNLNFGRRQNFDHLYLSFETGLGFRFKRISHHLEAYFETEKQVIENNVFVCFASPNGQSTGFNVNFTCRVGYIF